MWTLFPDLDPCFWSFAALSKIASSIGKPLYADPYTTDKSRISFARVLIDIYLSKDNPSLIPVKTPFGVKDVVVEYEWKPHFCHHCSSIGHSTNKCRKNTIKKTHAPPVQVWRPIPKEPIAPVPKNVAAPTIDNVAQTLMKMTMQIWILVLLTTKLLALCQQLLRMWMDSAKFDRELLVLCTIIMVLLKY